MITAQLRFNDFKNKQTQPDLIGDFKMGEQTFKVALWEQEHRTSHTPPRAAIGDCKYYTGNVQDVVDAPYSPKSATKIKLYQFAQGAATDPSYIDSALRTIGDQQYWIYGFWRLPNLSDETSLHLALELDPSPFPKYRDTHPNASRTAMFERYKATAQSAPDPFG